jgi:hypothetical protein
MDLWGNPLDCRREVAQAGGLEPKALFRALHFC